MNTAKTTALLLLGGIIYFATADRAAACAGDGSHSTLCSKTFFAEGECDGADRVVVLREPWESSPIEIAGVTIALSTPAPVPTGYVFAGNSFAADVMAFQLDRGSSTIMFPPGAGFALPAAHAGGAEAHVDLHVACATPPVAPRGRLAALRDYLLGRPEPASARMRFQAWLVVYYAPQAAARDGHGS